MQYSCPYVSCRSTACADDRRASVGSHHEPRFCAAGLVPVHLPGQLRGLLARLAAVPGRRHWCAVSSCTARPPLLMTALHLAPVLCSAVNSSHTNMHATPNPAAKDFNMLNRLAALTLHSYMHVVCFPDGIRWRSVLVRSVRICHSGTVAVDGRSERHVPDHPRGHALRLRLPHPVPRHQGVAQMVRRLPALGTQSAHRLAAKCSRIVALQRQTAVVATVRICL